MEKKYKLTQESFDSKKAELERLKNEGRIEMAERIKVARSFGDLSENAEYDEAMNDQAKLEDKISRLEDELDNCEIIDESSLSKDVVNTGSRVAFVNLDTKVKSEYLILSPSEAQPSEGIISDQCPIGRALIGAKQGDIVEVMLPSGGTTKLQVAEIKRK